MRLMKRAFQGALAVSTLLMRLMKRAFQGALAVSTLLTAIWNRASLVESLDYKLGIKRKNYLIKIIKDNGNS